jgi:hypothetical protein
VLNSVYRASGWPEPQLGLGFSGWPGTKNGPKGRAWASGQARRTVQARPGRPVGLVVPCLFGPCQARARAVPGRAARLLIYSLHLSTICPCLAPRPIQPTPTTATVSPSSHAPAPMATSIGRDHVDDGETGGRRLEVRSACRRVHSANGPLLTSPPAKVMLRVLLQPSSVGIPFSSSMESMRW